MALTVSSLLESVRGFDVERMVGLRPAYPPVAIEIDQDQIVLVRLKPHRRAAPSLEVHQIRPMAEEGAGSILKPNLVAPQEVVKRLADVFEKSGTRPGRISLILPDNLAKISLLNLPERPGSRRQLEEIVRFKVRRSVPFRLEEAALTYQVLPGEKSGINVLVALLRRAVVEQYERVLESIGARVGLFDLCTPNLFNLCRAEMMAASHNGDVALLNFTPHYFSLMIVRRENLIFFRCKSYAMADRPGHGPNGAMSREIAGSLSYYQEKLDGDGVRAAFVRSVAQPVEELAPMLQELGIEDVKLIDPGRSLALVEGLTLDSQVGQRIAPAVGAAAGRGR